MEWLSGFLIGFGIASFVGHAAGYAKAQRLYKKED